MKKIAEGWRRWADTDPEQVAALRRVARIREEDVEVMEEVEEKEVQKRWQRAAIFVREEAKRVRTRRIRKEVERWRRVEKEGWTRAEVQMEREWAEAELLKKHECKWGARDGQMGKENFSQRGAHCGASDSRCARHAAHITGSSQHVGQGAE